MPDPTPPDDAPDLDAIHEMVDQHVRETAEWEQAGTILPPGGERVRGLAEAWTKGTEDDHGDSAIAVALSVAGRQVIAAFDRPATTQDAP